MVIKSTDNPNFHGLGIAPNILTVLEKHRLTRPTPIQEKAIPSAIEGKDLMGLAQTGTGKTLAFGIPMMQAALLGKKGLVILPTRELALQVKEAFLEIGGSLGIRAALLVGGESINRQFNELHARPAIVIGTPGRIIDHLERRTLDLRSVNILVLDEADRMLDMGFAPQLKRILVNVPKERQTMLFSATMPETIMALAHSHMKLPLRIEIAPSGTASGKVTQEVFFVMKSDKSRLLEKLLAEYRGSVLIFSRTKFGARKIAAGARVFGHTAAEIHSNKSMNQRRAALEGFRNGKYRILAATDIAARGIDVKGIELVINYDLPSAPDDYVHRIGRTARAGEAGHAISFAEPHQQRDVRDIERLIRMALPQSKLPVLPPARSAPSFRRDVFPRHSHGRNPHPAHRRSFRSSGRRRNQRY